MRNPTVRNIILGRIERDGSVDMTPQQIVREFLENNDYTGLCYPEEECGCNIDDLFWAECCPNMKCRAGYARESGVYMKQEVRK